MPQDYILQHLTHFMRNRKRLHAYAGFCEEK